MSTGETVMFLSAFALGLFGGLVFGTQCIAPTIEKNHLSAVGIERIEKCHNVYSNWHEIVWAEKK